MHAGPTTNAARIAVLNGMAGDDIAHSVRRQAEWGLRDLDLKDSIYGRRVEDIDVTQAEAVRRAADAAGLRVYCLSSGLLADTAERLRTPGVAAAALGRVRRLLAVAGVLRPQCVRLIAPAAADFAARRRELLGRSPALEPVFDLYRHAIDLIADAGPHTVIENESAACLLASADEVEAFFDRIARPHTARFTWDVQNMWQTGTFPTIDVYRRLRPFIGYVHLKGGRADTAGGPLRWRSSLQDASWPVREIVQAVAADGVSPVICINPSHGVEHADWPTTNVAERDVRFLQGCLASFANEGGTA